jgi:hypothetical protein
LTEGEEVEPEENAGGVMAEYRCEASTLEGFIQQLAVAYIAHGYYFYVCGNVPEGKNPAKVDAKLMEKYGIGISKFTRYRRKALGRASVQYLRYGRFFVLLATHGEHQFFHHQDDGGEGDRINDARRTPIRFAGYSVSARKRSGDGTKLVAHVRIDQKTYLELRDRLVDHAPKRTAEWLELQFKNFPFEPYAPVRRQMVTMFQRVNEARSRAGLELLSRGCLSFKRRPKRPFEPAGQSQEVVEDSNSSLARP